MAEEFANSLSWSFSFKREMWPILISIPSPSVLAFEPDPACCGTSFLGKTLRHRSCDSARLFRSLPGIPEGYADAKCSNQKRCQVNWGPKEESFALGLCAVKGTRSSKRWSEDPDLMSFLAQI